MLWCCSAGADALGTDFPSFLQDVGAYAFPSRKPGGGGFGSPFMGGGGGGALSHAAQVFRSGFPAFPTMPSAAARPACLPSLQTLSAPLTSLPQVGVVVFARLQQTT